MFNKLKAYRYLAALCGLILATNVFVIKAYTATGTKDGGGGYVVKVGDQYKLLDFVEGGIEDSPYNPDVKVDQRILTYLQKNIGGPRPEVIERLANKFSHIYQTDPVMTAVMLQSATLFNWKFVAAPIVKLDDIGESNVDISKLEVYQAAIRKKGGITISREIYNQMSLENAAGLLMHEMVYTMTSPSAVVGPLKRNEAGGFEVVKTFNLHARLVVATLYSQLNDPAGEYAYAIYNTLWDEAKNYPDFFQPLKASLYLAESFFVGPKDPRYIKAPRWLMRLQLSVREVDEDGTFSTRYLKPITEKDLAEDSFVQKICEHSYGKNNSRAVEGSRNVKYKIIYTGLRLRKGIDVIYKAPFRSASEPEPIFYDQIPTDIPYLGIISQDSWWDATLPGGLENQIIETTEQCISYLKKLKPVTDPLEFLK
jgi:hypothetical protein